VAIFWIHIPSRLFRLLGDVTGRQRRALAEEKIFHVLRDEVLRFLLPWHEPVLIEDHLHPILPELPRLARDVLVDALAELARPGRRVGAADAVCPQESAIRMIVSGYWFIWLLVHWLLVHLVMVDLLCRSSDWPCVFSNDQMNQ
jgi:hypothetical protein